MINTFRFLGSFTLDKDEEFVKMSDWETGRMIEFKTPVNLSKGRWFLEIDDEHKRVVVSQILFSHLREYK